MLHTLSVVGFRFVWQAAPNGGLQRNALTRVEPRKQCSMKREPLRSDELLAVLLPADRHQERLAASIDATNARIVRHNPFILTITATA